MEQAQQDNLQTRMQAVAKLKRAASLPRMKDGRRPPMHPEAVSDGEKGPNDESKNGGASPEPAVIVAMEVDMDLEVETEEVERPVSPAPTARAKRRSRSRSRSRGSKDLKGKARAMQTPTPTSQTNGDSSPDEGPLPPPLNFAGLPNLASPIPSHMLELQRIRLLRSPTPTSPEPTVFNSGMMSQAPSLLPSLEALQKGLFRSNSAGGSNANRIMAMHKLTGGTESYDPASLAAGLSRNNTFTGGERLAARNNMFSRLGGRLTKEVDGDQPSGDDRPAPSPTPKRRRRRSRSRRGSTSVNAGISDSEFTSTSPNTPLVSQTPLPMSTDALPWSRSATPFQAVDSSAQGVGQPSGFFQIGESVQQREILEPPRRRSVVIEEDDPEPSSPPRVYASLPVLAARHVQSQVTALHIPHSSDTLSNGQVGAATTSAINLPVSLNQRTPLRTLPGNSLLRTSPFARPSAEVTERYDTDDDDEEQVLYGTDTHQSRTPFADAFDREISWIATPVPELDVRMPIDDDEEGEDDEIEGGAEQEREERQSQDEGPLSPRSSTGLSSSEHFAFNDTSSRISTDSKSLVVEFETSISHVPLSPSMFALSPTPSVTRASDDSTSSQVYPTRLSVASPLEFADSEDRGTGADTQAKRNTDGPTTWEKVKNTFSRAGSSSGRRSRTNSIATRERRDHVDSSVSRESGASLVSPKTDKGEPSNVHAQPQTPQPLMQSPSASASILSLVPHPPTRSGPSPIPPASPADLSRYQDAKLFPFPGMKKLEEQRRAKGLPSASASSPDIVMMSSSNDGDLSSLSPNSPTHTLQTAEVHEEHRLSHQASDGFIGKIKFPSPTTNPGQSTVSPQSSGRNGNSSLLPTTVEGVKNYMKWKRGPFAARSASPAVELRPPPSHGTLLIPDMLESGWEEIGLSPTIEGDVFTSKLPLDRDSRRNNLQLSESTYSRSDHTDMEKTPKAKKVLPPSGYSDDPGVPYSKESSSPSALLSRPDPFSSATPDPSSSLSDYPPRSTSESSSTTSSGYSEAVGLQGHVILEKLAEELARGSLSRFWSLEDDSRRKLLLSSPVFQVVNTNTLKDRFLFLFNDLLIIAKPVISDQDAFMDIYKPSPLDRKYIVKNVVMLNQLRFNADRTDSEGNLLNYSLSSRNPLMKSFIHNFAKDPDTAINTLLSKSGKAYDPVALGQLLSNSLDMDRTRHGEYLTRRSSKAVLKAYLDSFGFVGLRVDTALRVFLLSINIPARLSHLSNGLEYLLDAFAGRWYEANAKLVDYDKDCAHRLVRAIIQLNELLHDGIAHEIGPTGYPRREVTSGDFIEAFRRYDPRYLVTDRLLEDVYKSISEEKLSHARGSGGNSNVPVAMKRAIPVRLTWKVQSEPIIFRLPQVDPNFVIKLYGQDLDFTPSVLTFARSPEASFRVTGLALGSKSMIICRSGPNAINYTGLPSSSPIMVERAFMRHTFQMAFLNHKGTKRRYMFSVDDSLLRHQWVSYLRQHVDNATQLLKSTSPTTSKFRQASESIAFRVLQETLIGPSPLSINAQHQAPQHLNGSGRGYRFSPDRIEQTSNHNSPQLTSLHVRSKSRSKVYYKHGAGRNDVDLPNSRDYRGSLENATEGRMEYEDDSVPRNDGNLWSARDLELHCKHNGAIVSILFTYLQDSERDKGIL